MLGELNNEQTEALLSRELVGRIGCYAGDQVYVVPVTYAYDGTFVYAHSRAGLKIAMMRKNPRVCFEIDHMENLTNWESVIVRGTFEELEDESERTTAMKILVDRFRPKAGKKDAGPHHHGNPTDSAIVFRIRIKEKTGRFEKD